MTLFRIYLSLIALLTSIWASAVDFGAHFSDSTLRVDYLLSATPAGGRSVHLASQSRHPGWHGRRHRLAELPLLGNATVTMTSAATGDTIYRTSFSSLYHEWLSTEEATTTPRSFEHTVLLPAPVEKTDVTIEVLDSRHRPMAAMTHRVDPADILLASRPDTPSYPVRTLHQSKSAPEHTIDIAILPEGYTRAELDSFYVHAASAVDAILSHEPFRTYADRLTFRAVGVPSEQSGVSVPRLGQWRNTAFSSHFSTFYSDRYLTSGSVFDINDALRGVPYEHIIILANTEEYGGGGIYNSYTLTAARHPTMRPVVVHEFGHSFGGLADEYFYVGDVMDDTYPTDTEPWEPNITTMTDFPAKWQAMLPSGVPVPTPESEASKWPVGVYEGAGYSFKGLYRPADQCRMRSNDHPEFCPVCRASLAALIRFYTEP